MADIVEWLRQSVEGGGTIDISHAQWVRAERAEATAGRLRDELADARRKALNEAAELVIEMAESGRITDGMDALTVAHAIVARAALSPDGGSTKEGK